MKKDIKLIGTLPHIHNKKAVEEMMSSEYISEVRFNTGVNELLEEKKIIEILKSLEEKFNKKIWIDLKGRQLRVNSWADTSYEAIELNHKIDIEYPIIKETTTEYLKIAPTKYCGPEVNEIRKFCYSRS